MPIPININPLGVVKNKGYRCLTFVAQENNCTVSLNIINGSPVVNGLQYRLQDNGTWMPYSCGTVITLSNVGDIVQFQNTNSQLNTSNADYVQFITTKQIGACGVLESMINYSKTIPDYGFIYLFQKTTIVTAPKITSLIVGEYGLYGTFDQCLSLNYVPDMDINTIYNKSCQRMFFNCTSLVNAPNFNIKYAYSYHGCRQMFYLCTNLVNPPKIIGTSIQSGLATFAEIFSGCIRLSIMPRIAFPSSGTVGASYLSSAFKNCENLNESIELDEIVISNNCYEQMFYGCKNLTTVRINATSFGTNSMKQMFYGCSKLNYVEVDFTNWNNGNSTSEWLYGVSSTGTFKCPSTLDTTNRNSNYIPENWTIINRS